MDGLYSLIITTIDDATRARAIAASLLEKRLAACVQIFPVESHFVWQDKVQCEAEHVLHIKARTEDFEALRNAILAAHSYDVPEIIRLDITAGHKPYLDWISTETTR